MGTNHSTKQSVPADALERMPLKCSLYALEAMYLRKQRFCIVLNGFFGSHAACLRGISGATGDTAERAKKSAATCAADAATGIITGAHQAQQRALQQAQQHAHATGAPTGAATGAATCIRNGRCSRRSNGHCSRRSNRQI